MWKTLLSIFKATTSPYGITVQIRKVPFLKTLGFHLLRNVIINIQSDSVGNGDCAHYAVSCGPVYATETYLFWQEAVSVNPYSTVVLR